MTLCQNVHTHLLLNSKVDNGRLWRNLRRVMGVWHLGGYVEPKLWIVLHLPITQLQQQPATWVTHLGSDLPQRNLTASIWICEKKSLFVCVWVRLSDLSEKQTCWGLGSERAPAPPGRSAAKRDSQTGWHPPAPAGSLAFESLFPSAPAGVAGETRQNTRSSLKSVQNSKFIFIQPKETFQFEMIGRNNEVI